MAPFDEGWYGEHFKCFIPFCFKNIVNSSAMNCGPLLVMTYSGKRYAEKSFFQFFWTDFGVQRFHQYLYGRKFALVTDHKPLLSILGPKNAVPPLAAARFQRWAVLLSAYSYDVELRRTERHANADSLSRLLLKNQYPNADQDKATIFSLCQVEYLPMTALEVQKASRNDLKLNKVCLSRWKMS